MIEVISFNFEGVIPLYWIEDKGKHVLLPSIKKKRSNEIPDYMKYETYKEFLAWGQPTNQWKEYDISRLPSNKGCK